MATNLQIPNPCAEKWADMTTTGFDCRFCATCQHNVVDFTKKTDAEILAHLRRNEGRICGRFRTDQLNRSLIGPRVQRRVGLTAIAAGFATMLSAQQPTMQGQKAPEIVIEAEQRGSTSEPAPTADAHTISGKVVDTETGAPLVGCTVMIENTPSGTATNKDGVFLLQIPQPFLSAATLNLLVTYTGYEQETVSILMPHSTVEAGLKVIELCPLMENVVTGRKVTRSEMSVTSGMLVSVTHNPPPPTLKQRVHRFFHKNR